MSGAAPGREAQAVILAAGRGARLSERTDELPKALLPIGPRTLGDPRPTCFLRRQAELLRSLGMEQVVVVVGYRRDQVTEQIHAWGPWVQVVVNPAPDITRSGSLESFQWAVRCCPGLLDGRRRTLMMDADIVYHRRVLELLLEVREGSAMLVCDHRPADLEEVLVYGTHHRPRFMGKGLTPALADGAPCLGEAAGIVSIAPRDQALARALMDWMLGDPDAPEGDPRRRGFGPARKLTEHEELTQRLMHHGRMRCVVFGKELPFIEVDSAEEYRLLREEVYPRLLQMEAG